MNKTEALQTAETIFEQLGSKQRLRLFVGAENFAFRNLEKEEKVEASFKFKGSRKMNHCKITYNRCPDDYMMQFYKVGKTGAKLIKTITPLYCDTLINVFECETDLYLHF